MRISPTSIWYTFSLKYLSSRALLWLFRYIFLIVTDWAKNNCYLFFFFFFFIIRFSQPKIITMTIQAYYLTCFQIKTAKAHLKSSSVSEVELFSIMVSYLKPFLERAPFRMFWMHLWTDPKFSLEPFQYF